MRILASAALFLVAGAVSAEEVRHTFRGGNAGDRLFRYDGPTAEQFVSPEGAGLRWRFLAGHAPTRPVGLYWRFPVRGDFVATVRYEILQADQTEDGLGAGVELYLMLDGPAREGISFARLTRLTFLHLSNNEAGKRYAKQTRYFPATPESECGRLRLARTGTTLIASLALGEQDQFQEIHRAEIGVADIRMVRFAGTSGGDVHAGLDMRLLEFELQAQELGRQGKFVTPPPRARVANGQDPDKGGENAEDADESSVSPLLVWGITLAILACLALSYFWLRKPKDKAPAASHDSLTALRCAHCGKGLKVKSALAGKKVKCPGCEKVLAVPEKTQLTSEGACGAIRKSNASAHADQV